MPLNKTTLANAIKAGIDGAFTAAANPEGDTDQIRQNYANAIADAFDTYVKSARITFAPGAIQVQGTASAQQNGSPLTIDSAIS